MHFFKALCLLFIASIPLSSCVEEGCLDPRANNYKEGADQHNGDCQYDGCLKADVTCENGGTCNENGECDCPSGYFGDRCQKTKTPSAFSIETIYLINNEFDNEDIFITVVGESGKQYVKTEETSVSKGETFRFLGIGDSWFIDSVKEKNTIKVVDGFSNRAKASIDTVLYREEIGLPDTLRFPGRGNQDFQIEMVVDYQF